jgi:hypothetical protein
LYSHYSCEDSAVSYGCWHCLGNLISDSVGWVSIGSVNSWILVESCWHLNNKFEQSVKHRRFETLDQQIHCLSKNSALSQTIYRVLLSMDWLPNTQEWRAKWMSVFWGICSCWQINWLLKIFHNLLSLEVALLQLPFFSCRLAHPWHSSPLLSYQLI